MTSRSAPSLHSFLFSAGLLFPDVHEKNSVFPKETEAPQGSLQMEMHSALGDLSPSMPRLPESVGAVSPEPDQLSLVMVLVATVAGIVLVICTSF